MEMFSFYFGCCWNSSSLKVYFISFCCIVCLSIFLLLYAEKQHNERVTWNWWTTQQKKYVKNKNVEQVEKKEHKNVQNILPSSNQQQRK